MSHTHAHVYVQTYYLQRCTRDGYSNNFTLIEHVRVMDVMHTTGVQTLQLVRSMHVKPYDYVVTTQHDSTQANDIHIHTYNAHTKHNMYTHHTLSTHKAHPQQRTASLVCMCVCVGSVSPLRRSLHIHPWRPQRRITMGVINITHTNITFQLDDGVGDSAFAVVVEEEKPCSSTGAASSTGAVMSSTGQGARRPHAPPHIQSDVQHVGATVHMGAC